MRIYFRLFKLSVLLIFLLLFTVSLLFFLSFEYIKKHDIKNYISAEISEYFKSTIVFRDFEITFPNSIMLLDTELYENNIPVINSKNITLHINLPLSIKQRKLLLTGASLVNTELKVIKKDNHYNIEKLIERLNSKNETSYIPELNIENLKISLNDLDSNTTSYFQVKTLKLTKNQTHYRITLNTTYTKDRKVDIELKSDIYTEGKPTLENLKITIIAKKQKIYISTRKTDTKNPVFTIYTSGNLNLKDIINIPQPIIIPRTKSKLYIKSTENYYIITIPLEKLNTTAEIFISKKNKKISTVKVKSKKADIKLFSNYTNSFIKNPYGSIDLDLFYETEKNFYKITSYSENLVFNDFFNLVNFKDTEAKLIITPKFSALNIINTTGNFPYGTIKGHAKMEFTENKDTISSSFKLNDITAKVKLILKNIKSSVNKKFYFDVFTSKFDRILFYNIFEYYLKKTEKFPENPKSRYYIRNKKVKIFWESLNLNDPYLDAEKVLILSNIYKFNNYMKLNGNFKIKLLNGKIKNIEENSEKSKIYRLMLLPVTSIFKLNRAGSLRIDSKIKNIVFHDAGIDFDLNNGKIIINKFYINAEKFLVYVKGKVDLNTEILDIEAYIINSKYYKVGALPESITDSKGRPSLALKIKGKFSDNKSEIMDATDITKLVEDEVKKSIIIRR